MKWFAGLGLLLFAGVFLYWLSAGAGTPPTIPIAVAFGDAQQSHAGIECLTYRHRMRQCGF